MPADRKRPIGGLLSRGHGRVCDANGDRTEVVRRHQIRPHVPSVAIAHHSLTIDGSKRVGREAVASAYNVPALAELRPRGFTWQETSIFRLERHLDDDAARCTSAPAAAVTPLSPRSPTVRDKAKPVRGERERIFDRHLMPKKSNKNIFIRYHLRIVITWISPSNISLHSWDNVPTTRNQGRPMCPQLAHINQRLRHSFIHSFGHAPSRRNRATQFGVGQTFAPG